MKQYQLVSISVIIGAVLAVSSMSYHEAYAMEIDEVMAKMIEIDSKLSNLKNTDGNFDELTMSKTSFKIKQIQDTLLEINEINDKNNDNVNKIYDYLKTNYNTELKKYQKDVKNYQKENGLTMQEKKLVTDLLRNKITFENNESAQDSKKIQQESINTAIKETEIKENYQKLINKIGVKLANEANGGKILKVHHKIAIKEIVNSKSWNLAIPAIDRIITQTNNDEMKNKLTKIKNDIKESLDKKEKQNQVVTLRNDKGAIIDLNTNEIGFASILGQSFENEIIESLISSEEIISEFEEEIEQSLESNVEESSTIQVIFEEELIQSLEEVEDISDEDDNELEDKREKQRKDAREDKGKNKSIKAKEVLKDKENKQSNENKKDNENKQSNENKKDKKA